MDKVTYCLDADPRPTCVLRLDFTPRGAHIDYKNNALREQNHLVDDLLDAGVSTGFHAWVLDGGHSGTVAVTGQSSLHAYTIEQTWRVIQWIIPEKPSSGHGPNGQNSTKAPTSPLWTKGDPLTLDRKL